VHLGGGILYLAILLLLAAAEVRPRRKFRSDAMVDPLGQFIVVELVALQQLFLDKVFLQQPWHFRYHKGMVVQAQAQMEELGLELRLETAEQGKQARLADLLLLTQEEEGEEQIQQVRLETVGQAEVGLGLIMEMAQAELPILEEAEVGLVMIQLP
jgi:hypothetical protein